MINQEWTIQGRGHQCHATGEMFVEGQYFYTLLFDEGSGYRREDLSEPAFKQRPADAPKPYSFWRSKFEPPPAAPPEALGKQTAEDLLRRYMDEDDPKLANARYILALMLERKRLLKEKEVKKDGDRLTRIYEHSKTGEIFVIPDPQLRLDQLADIQTEIAEQLAGGPQAPASAPATAPSAADAPASPTEAEATVAASESAEAPASETPQTSTEAEAMAVTGEETAAPAMNETVETVEAAEAAEPSPASEAAETAAEEPTAETAPDVNQVEETDESSSEASNSLGEPIEPIEEEPSPEIAPEPEPLPTSPQADFTTELSAEPEAEAHPSGPTEAHSVIAESPDHAEPKADEPPAEAPAHQPEAATEQEPTRAAEPHPETENAEEADKISHPEPA